jgi:hypothetical protein
MNFSVEQAMQLGAARQGGRESMIPQLDSASHLLQLAEFRADNTQRRINVKSLQDFGTFSKANLYALADSEDDIRVLPSLAKIGETLHAADPSGYKAIFHPRGGQGDLENRNIRSAIEHGRIRQVEMQAPSVPGVTKTYKLPSGHTLLRIATQEEISAAEAEAAAEAAAEAEAAADAAEESDDDQFGFDQFGFDLYPGAQIIEPNVSAAAAEEFDDPANAAILWEQIIQDAEQQALNTTTNNFANEYDDPLQFEAGDSFDIFN